MSQEPLIFFGTDAFSLPSLVRLIAEKRPIAAVVTKPDTLTGRGRHLTAPVVKRLAEANSIPVIQPSRLRDIEIPLNLHPQPASW
jgi:methionyl-tRNA formyltransferase